MPSHRGRACGRAGTPLAGRARRRGPHARPRGPNAARRAGRRPGCGGNRLLHGGSRLALGGCGPGQGRRRGFDTGGRGGPTRLGPVAGDRRARAPAAAGERTRRTRRSEAPPRRPARSRSRGPSGPGGFHLRAHGGIRPARSRGRPGRRDRRGRHRRGQDGRLYRAGEPLGGTERRSGLDQHVHAQPAAPDRHRARPAPPRSGREAPPRGDPQGPGQLSVPPEPGGGAGARGHRCRGRHRARSGRALDRGDPGRRHGRRRFPCMARRSAGAAQHAGPRAPARRMHLLGLRALPQMLHRAHRAPRPAGRHRGRQPCAGDDPRRRRRDRRPVRARPRDLRRGPSRVRCRRRCFRGTAGRPGGRRSQALAARRRGRARTARAGARPPHRGCRHDRRRARQGAGGNPESGEDPAGCRVERAPRVGCPARARGNLPRGGSPAGLCPGQGYEAFPTISRPRPGLPCPG